MSIQRSRLLLLILLLFMGYAYVLPRWSDWSQNSRIDFVLSLVDDGTVYIDNYAENTGDYAIYAGHKYSDKAPGTAFMAMPFYIGLRPLLDHPLVRGRIEAIAQSSAFVSTLREGGSGVREGKVRFALLQYILTAMTIALPAALFGAVFYCMLLRLGLRKASALLCVLGYALGTTVAPYASNFYSHQVVAALLFGAFTVAWKHTPTMDGGGRSEADVRSSSGSSPFLVDGVLCGLLLGWAVISEYPAAIPAAAIGVYVLHRHGWRWLGPLAIGAVPPLALLVVHDLIAFGTALPIGYAHSAYWGDQMRTGFMSITYPHAEALWGLIFGGFRGLFVRAPWLLLAFPGYVVWWRSGRLRAEWWVALIAPVSVYLFYSSSQALWWGGFAAGPRYLVMILPFLALPAAWWVGHSWKWAMARVLVFALVGLSITMTWAEALAGQLFPDEAIRATWSGYVLPAWERGDIARNLGMVVGLHGVMSLVPLLGLLAVLIALCVADVAHRTTKDVRALISVTSEHHILNPEKG